MSILDARGRLPILTRSEDDTEVPVPEVVEEEEDDETTIVLDSDESMDTLLAATHILVLCLLNECVWHLTV
jgi:hypothetical protein